ncbi:MAG: hypothetical protein D5R97_07610 [Candidatus Syntrophonatronum acetioxidans]|uniref:Uncharacterized protein n=1 Tax=Candidatus Syntrophonatronum acetioxidans TaxID=1795816 RepID=A0A424YBR0_9FIRM|nr:MAG: hypothetical protein D5R97_07610 [Candidatus Syntrophonatronum acetioxidans]
MKRFIVVLTLSALAILIIPSADYYLNQGELFGLWTAMMGTVIGTTLIFTGLIFIIFSGFVIILRQKEAAKNISLNGLSIMAIGILIFTATTVFWFMVGQPFLF